jgi:hypothetical protein
MTREKELRTEVGIFSEPLAFKVREYSVNEQWAMNEVQ